MTENLKYIGAVCTAQIRAKFLKPRVHLVAEWGEPSLCGLEPDGLEVFIDDNNDPVFDPARKQCCVHCRRLHVRKVRSKQPQPSKKPKWASGRALGVYLRPGVVLYPRDPREARLGVVAVHGSTWAMVNFLEGGPERLTEDEIVDKYLPPEWICKTNTPATIVGQMPEIRGY